MTLSPSLTHVEPSLRFLRRTGRPANARELLLAAVRDIEPRGSASPDQLSMYGTLLEAAAYTCCGRRQSVRRQRTHRRGQGQCNSARRRRQSQVHCLRPNECRPLPGQASLRCSGDSGTAIEHAKTVRPSAIPTAERQGRYWIDVARAYHQWDKPEPCYRALLAAEHCAPDEVRYRPPVHRIAEDLLRANRRQSLPGLPAFARRIGVPVQ